MRTDTATTPPSTAAPRSDAPFVAEVMERISDGFVAYDRDWRVLYMNRSAEQFWGRRREELLGRVVWEAMPEAVGTESERRLRDAASRPGVTEYEVRSAVVQRWAAVRVYPFDGGVALYLRDVTEAREAEQALRESEARFRALFEYSAEGICLTAPDGRIFAANPAACAMLGRTEEELCRLGRGATVDVADPRVQRFLEARRRLGHAHSEHDLLHADGRKIAAEVTSVIFESAAGEQLTAMTFHDVSERNRAQRALELLARSSEVLNASLDDRATVQSLAELVVPAVADMSFVDLVEPEGVARIGAAHRDPALAGSVAFVRHRLDERAEARVMKVLRTGQVELVPELDDGWLHRAVTDPANDQAFSQLHPRSALMVPLRAEGRTLGVLSLVNARGSRPFDAEDVPLAQSLADRAALAVRNAQLYRQVLEAKQLREETLGVVSHDLRTPLNTIAIVAKVLQKRGLSGPELDAIKNAVQSADRLIHDLLAATKAESGALQLERAPCPPGELVREAVAAHLTVAQNQQVTLTATVDEALPELSLDRYRILQLLANLIGNALKFTPEQGTVTVFARRAQGGVELAVTDSGPGIPPAHLARLFDRYWQGAQSRHGGAGLGLAIVKGIAEAHGGAVRVESQVGHGATFVVFLPVS